MIEFRGQQYDIVTLDFETAWDKDYTLTKMPTSAYVKDKRFLAQMVGIKINDGPTKVYTEKAHIIMALASIDWKRSLLLCHNTAFDGYILTQRYKLKPAGYLDTLSMARAVLGHGVRHGLNYVGPALGLGAKVDKESLDAAKGLRVLPPELIARMTPYCAGDVDLCHAVFWKMYDHFPDDELELVDTTIRMFCEPVLEIDRALVEEELEDEIGGKMRALMLTGVSKDTLLSNQKFANELTRRGVPVPAKKSLTTGKVTCAFAKTDAGFQALLSHQDESIRKLAQARLTIKSTIGETRAQRFLDTCDAGGKMPVLLNYYGAHTGRWSGGNKINLQNLPRGGRLRRALRAPKGKVLVVADSAQIEARVNAWLWGQTDLLEAFISKRDIYSEFATCLFGRPIDRKRKELDASGEEFYPDFNEGFVGKTAILGLGYQMGAPKFLDTVRKAGVHLTLEQAATAVDLYREQNAMIVRGWKRLQQYIPRMGLPSTEIPLGPVTLLHEAVRLPNGLFLRYPGMMTVPSEYGGGESSFQGRKHRVKLYGGLLCIGEGTAVLSSRGWIRIEEVLPNDLIHDGVEFVAHGGLLNKSVQDCVSVDGVAMTAGHEVLTNEGWKTALEKPRPFRPDLRGVASAVPNWVRWEEDAVDVSMRVRQADGESWSRGNKSSAPELRMPDQGATASRENARNVASPSVCSMELNARSMLQPETQSVGALRGQGNLRMQEMASVRNVLGGYGDVVQSRAYVGSTRQQQRIFAEQLPMDYLQAANAEQTKQSPSRYTGDLPADGNTSVDVVLPAGSRARPVYDILDCGPRKRFVVAGREGPFIVHNCENLVQALARIAIGEQLLAMQRLGYRAVTTTHDEIVVMCTERQAEKCLQRMLKIMSTAPDWAPGLPLAAEGGWSREYSK